MRCEPTRRRKRLTLAIAIAYTIVVGALLLRDADREAQDVILYLLLTAVFWCNAIAMRRTWIEVSDRGVGVCRGFRTTRVSWEEVQGVERMDDWLVRMGLRAPLVVRRRARAPIGIRVEAPPDCLRQLRRQIEREAADRGVPRRRG